MYLKAILNGMWATLPVFVTSNFARLWVRSNLRIAAQLIWMLREILLQSRDPIRASKRLMKKAR